MAGIFLLGFAGKPEDSPWLNSSQLWQKGDPFFWEGVRFLASPYFLYRGRPNVEGEWSYYGVRNQYRHNELGLRDDPLIDPKPTTVFRILNIGDSSTWGLSLQSRSDTYSDRLEKALNADPDRPEGIEYDVVNGGTVGYSSWQALRWLEFYIGELKPDVVTVYIGNNDSAPGGISDATRGSMSFGPVTRVLGHNAFYLLLQKAWLNLGKRARDEERQDFISSIRNEGRAMTKAEWYRASARVAYQDYETNLRAIVDVARKNDARVILLKVPMNFVWPGTVAPDRRQALERKYWYPVFIEESYLATGLSRHAPCDSPFMSHRWLCMLSVEQVNAHLARKTRFHDVDHFLAERDDLVVQPEADRLKHASAIHRLAMAHVARGAYAKAVQRLRSLTEASGFESESSIPDRARADIHHALGVSLLLDGRRDQARSAFIRSREAFPFAMTYEYYDAFDKVVAELEVEWIDLPYLFERSDPEYFGSSLMHDWVHPSADGNKIISDAIAAQISVRSRRRIGN